MKAHPSDTQIIDYLFKLGSERRLRRIAAHLDACAQCREQADRLRKKLAALDALKEDITAPERLIADTLREIRKLRPSPEPALIPKWAWVLAPAAAAAVVLALLLPRAARRAEPDLLAMAKHVQRQITDEDAEERKRPEVEPRPEMELESVREVTFEERRVQLALNGEATRDIAAESFEADSLVAHSETPAASAPLEIEVAMADTKESAAMLEQPVAAPAPTKPPPPAPGWTEVYALAAHAPARGAEGLSLAARALKMAPPDEGAAAERSFAAGRPVGAAAVPRAARPAEPEKIEWNVGPNRSIRVAQELAGFSRDPGDPARGRWSWNVVVESTSDQPAAVRLARRFADTDWKLEATDTGITVSRQTPLQALITFDLPPYGERSFTYSVEAPVRETDP